MAELNAIGEQGSDMEKHIAYTREKLDEIGCDMHRLMEMEEEEMTEGFDSGMLTGLLSKQGVDPGIVAMLNDRRDRGDWGDGGMLVLFILLILCGGWNGFGNRNGDCGVERAVNSASDYGILMDTINSTGTKHDVAMQNLAQTLNCNQNQLQAALAGVDKQLAVNNGDMKATLMNVENSLAAQLSSCCCSTKQLISEQGCSTRAAIQDVRYLISNSQAAQDSLIQSQFASQNSMIQAQHCETLNAIHNGFANLELRTLQDQNDRLREQIASQSQAAQTAAILAAINGRNQVAVSGTVNTTAGTWTGNGQISSP